jgi:hypothetical protein
MTAVADLADVKAYRVETHGRRIGSVAAVLPRAGLGATGALLVHESPTSCRLVTVPLDAVESVDREGRRVLLREGAPPGARDRVGSDA